MKDASGEHASRGIIYAVVSPLVSGVATVLFAACTRYFPPLIASSVSAILGATLLGLILRLSGASIRWDAVKKEWRVVIQLAIVRIVLGSSLFALGLKHTEAIKAVFFTKIEPYFVIFWGWVLFRDKVTRSEFFLLAIHLFGAFLVSTGGITSGLGHAQFGDLLIIVSMFVSGYSYFIARQVTSSVGASTAAVVSELLGGLLMLPIAILCSDSFSFSDVPTIGWIYFGLNLLLFNVVALPLWFYALRTVRGWIVSAVRAVGPLAGAPAAYFILDESLNSWQLVGGIFVVSTSAWIARAHFKTKS